MLEQFGFIVFWAVLIRVFLWLFWIPIKKLWKVIAFSKKTSQNQWRPSPENWAIITGGTDGIGLAYCRKLAEIGYPLLIISRTESKLNEVKESLINQFPKCPVIKTVAFDFSENDIAKYDHLQSLLDELPNIDVLVNNVGISFKTAEYFTVISSTSSSLLTSMININVVSMCKMTRMVWNRMIDKNRGIIINVGSISALNPVPLLALYSATKAFVDYFSQCLSLESKNYDGVFVQSVLPGFVSTKMSSIRVSWRVPNADDYVRSAITTVHQTNRTFGYWFHSLLGALYQTMNFFLGTNFNSWLAFHELSKLRKRYYRIKKLKDPRNRSQLQNKISLMNKKEQ